MTKHESEDRIEGLTPADHSPAQSRAKPDQLDWEAMRNRLTAPDAIDVAQSG